jgi:predicted enzyme related to lactoylglutathione lyase
MAEGAISWWELDVADIEKATQFYGAVLSAWTLQPMEGYAGYVIVNVDGAQIGALQASEASDPSGRAVTLYFLVADLEDTLERARQAGGTVEQERMQVPGDQWIGLIRDPFGTKVGFATNNPA